MITKPSTPDFTFLLISRNASNTILKTIQSIRKLSRSKNTEIILVDDHSEDTTVSMAKPLCDKVLVNKARMGIGFSRRKGLFLASANKVFVIDSDIEITSINFQKLDQLFSKGIVAISGSYNSNDNQSNWNKALDLRRKYIYFKDKRVSIADKSRYVTFSGGFCVIDIEKVGGIKYFGKKDTSAEDVLFQLKLLHRGLKTAFSPALVGIHHHHRNTRSFFQKVMADSVAYPWLMSLCLKNKISMPVLEQAFNFPIFLIASFFIPNFQIKSLLLTLEFFPQIYVVFSERFSISSFRLLIYAVAQSLIKVLAYAKDFIFGKYSSSDRILYIKNLLMSDFVSKTNWLKQTFIQ